MPSNQSDFQVVQRQLAAHIRNPNKNSAPSDIEERRLKVYRELIFNNIVGFIESGFPVLTDIVPQDIWHESIRDFVSNYRAQSPYFAEVSKEFLSYLQQGDHKLNSEYPFIEELAHYEWVELALMIATEDISSVPVAPSLNFMEEPVVLSPLAWPLAYHYDVHRISSEYCPKKPPPQPTFIVVYRRRDDEVSFMEINAVTYQLLETLKRYPDATGGEVIQRLQNLLPQIDPNMLEHHGKDALIQLFRRDIILTAKAQRI